MKKFRITTITRDGFIEYDTYEACSTRESMHEHCLEYFVHTKGFHVTFMSTSSTPHIISPIKIAVVCKTNEYYGTFYAEEINEEGENK